jgi:hypothetical protein
MKGYFTAALDLRWWFIGIPRKRKTLMHGNAFTASLLGCCRMSNNKFDEESGIGSVDGSTNGLRGAFRILKTFLPNRSFDCRPLNQQYLFAMCTVTV